MSLTISFARAASIFVFFRKAIWFSCSADLYHDARRDLDELGGSFIPIRDLKSFTYNKIDSGSSSERFEEGVLFSSYSTLMAEMSARGSKKKTRFQQITGWFGRGYGSEGKSGDYDGLIIFDEAHKAKAAGKKKKQQSKTGSLVVKLQEVCNNARIVYVSATPASRPNELKYMARCGYWGGPQLAYVYQKIC